MLELAGAWWRRSLSRTGHYGRDGHSTELLAVAVTVALALALAVPLGLALWVNPGDGHTVNRLLNACQEGMRRGPFAMYSVWVSSMNFRPPMPEPMLMPIRSAFKGLASSPASLIAWMPAARP